MKIRSTFWLLTITFFLGAFIPMLVQEGMFVDGVTYSTISNNLANGYGNFLNLHYTQTLDNHFFSHPPLVFIIQSFFFKIFGDSFITERIYCLVIAILTILGIIKCWQLFNKKNGLIEYDWLPILLWTTIPLIIWSYQNNLLDNTMGVFTIFSVFFILKSLMEEKTLYLFFGSLLIICSFFSKGFTGLFPLSIPLLYALVYDNKKHSLLYFIYLNLFLISAAYILYLVFPELLNNIEKYIHKQLIPSLNNELEVTTTNRFSILFDLVFELSFPILLLILFTIKNKIKIQNLSFFKHKDSFMFLLIALSASLPLIITLKQRKLYLGPSIPFYIISIALIISPLVKTQLEKIELKYLTRIKQFSAFLILSVLILSGYLYKNFSRDKEKLLDIYIISEVVPKRTILNTTKEIWYDWTFLAYMSRIGYLSLDYNHDHEYLILEKKDMTLNSFKEYEVIDLPLKKYVLLHHNNVKKL
jgi:hypothetical protein